MAFSRAFLSNATASSGNKARAWDPFKDRNRVLEVRCTCTADLETVRVVVDAVAVGHDMHLCRWEPRFEPKSKSLAPRSSAGCRSKNIAKGAVGLEVYLALAIDGHRGCQAMAGPPTKG